MPAPAPATTASHLAPDLRPHRRLASQLIGMTLAGMAVLVLALLAVEWQLMRVEATRLARDRVDSNMWVAWSQLQARGSTYRIEQGKMCG